MVYKFVMKYKTSMNYKIPIEQKIIGLYLNFCSLYVGRSFIKQRLCIKNTIQIKMF